MATYNERIEILALLLADARKEMNNLTELLEQAARQHMRNLQEIAKTQALLAITRDVLADMQVASREWQTKRKQALSDITKMLDKGDA